MKKFKPNLVLAAGLLLFAAAKMLESGFGISHPICDFLIGAGVGLELIGGLKLAKHGFLKESKFRQWKLGLLGKDGGQS